MVTRRPFPKLVCLAGAKLVRLAGAVCISASLAHAADPAFVDPTPSQAHLEADPGPQWGLQSVGSFVYWKGNRGGGRGTQYIQTVEGSVAHTIATDLRLRFAVKTGYLYSRRAGILGSGTHSGITDTSTRVQLAYEGWTTIQPFVSLDLNLPTGRETITGRRRFAIMDRDLVPITRFGEGWNVNPAIGFSIPIGPHLSATLAIGHNFRGRYTPDAALGDRFDPGDQTIATIGITYADTRWFVAGNLIATRESVSRINSLNFYEPGIGFTASLRGAFQWDAAHTTSAHVLYSSTGSNKTLDPFIGVFAREAQNANSNLFIVAGAHEYAFTPVWRVFLSAEYLNRTKNSFDPSVLEFIPAKDRVMVEAGLKAQLPGGLEGQVSYGQYVLHQDATPNLARTVIRAHVARFAVAARF